MSATFLTEEQIWGDKALGIFKKYGTTVGLSDLAVLLGGMLTGSGERTTDGLRAGYVWSASPNPNSNVVCVDMNGSRCWFKTWDSECRRAPRFANIIVEFFYQFAQRANHSR